MYEIFLWSWGLRLAALVGAMLRGSQVCSALQAPLRFAFGLAFAPPSTALGRGPFGRLWQLQFIEKFSLRYAGNA